MSTGRLDIFLEEHTTVTEMSHVVYIFSEIRKIMDSEETGHYPMLRFYCDCAIRTEKEKISEEAEELLRKMSMDAIRVCEKTSDPEPSMTHPYLLAENLRKEMKSFLEEKNLKTDLIGKDNWTTFMTQLVFVMCSAEMVSKPVPWIRHFMFGPADEQTLKAMMSFEEPEHGHYYIMITGK